MAGHGGTPSGPPGLATGRHHRRGSTSSARWPRPGCRRYGPVWPPNSHFAGLLAPHAKGGTFITGVGGDEVLSPSAYEAARVLSGVRRPRPHDVRGLAAVVAPLTLRARAARGRIQPLPWLTPDAAASHARAGARDSLQPLWWGKSVTHAWWRSRERLALRASIAAACGDDVTVHHPFMDPDFLSAVAGAMWRTGFGTRAGAMQLLFGDSLPEQIRHRSDKAAFRSPFVDRHSRATSSRGGMAPASTRPLWTSRLSASAGRQSASTPAHTPCCNRRGWRPPTKAARQTACGFESWRQARYIYVAGTPQGGLTYAQEGV